MYRIKMRQDYFNDNIIISKSNVRMRITQTIKWNHIADKLNAAQFRWIDDIPFSFYFTLWYYILTMKYKDYNLYDKYTIHK